MVWWFVACRGPSELRPDLTWSEFVPTAARVDWNGPAGHAVVSADPGLLGAWQVVSEADVEDGPSSLPLYLLPAGTWRWRVEVDDGRRLWRSPVGSIDLPDPPVEMGHPHLESVDVGDSQLAGGGYWVGYHYGYKEEPENSIPLVVDREGRVVWWVPADGDYRAMRVKPGADGQSILVLEDHEDGAKRRLLRYALDGSVREETTTPDASHDFWEDDDGTITYDSYVFSDTELMPGHRGPVAADHLRTLPEGATDLTDAQEGFDFFQDFPRDPWWPCSHGNYDVFVPGASEWSHVNSVIRSPKDDGWLLQVRFLNAVMLVDGHERKWQVGGDDATLTPTSPEALFEHGHSSDAWLDDQDRLHLLVFDNGDHSPLPIVSRVVELRIEPNPGGAGGTVSAVWQLEDPNGTFDAFLGDARRLPNGNTLVVWTPRGSVVEYTPDGRDVWHLDMDGSVGRGSWVPTLGL